MEERTRALGSGDSETISGALVLDPTFEWRLMILKTSMAASVIALEEGYFLEIGLTFEQC